MSSESNLLWTLLYLLLIYVQIGLLPCCAKIREIIRTGPKK